MAGGKGQSTRLAGMVLEGGAGAHGYSGQSNNVERSTSEWFLQMVSRRVRFGKQRIRKKRLEAHEGET